MTYHYFSLPVKLDSTRLDFSCFDEVHFAKNVPKTIYSKIERLNIIEVVRAMKCDGADNSKKGLEQFGNTDRV
jgi:hypothetical protein